LFATIVYAIMLVTLYILNYRLRILWAVSLVRVQVPPSALIYQALWSV